MSISIFEIFSIGVGPSSSHTVGPMKAAKAYIDLLQSEKKLEQTARIQIDLYGSLALTGKGHGTDIAILNGLEGHSPNTVDPDKLGPNANKIIETQKIHLNSTHTIPFTAKTDLLFHYQLTLPLHANGMRFTVFNANNEMLLTKVYYSIGGGFIIDEENFNQTAIEEHPVPYPFSTAKELLDICANNNLRIRDVMWANERTWRSDEEIRSGILNISNVMRECIERGCRHDGILPGGLNVKRRAPELYRKLTEKKFDQANLSETMNWLNCYALAVNEENAAGGRVVTAPTNGAAGIIPAVQNYYLNFCQGDEEGVLTYLLTACAIAILYKKGASISAAEVGCQGEVGVACSMAAGALTAVLGGTLPQIENAAEIGMEHHLGLTCDPIMGLVQIPCIERNAMGTVKAVNIAHLALMEEGEHIVSLDKVIATMLQTGKDMQTRYKETSQGGLAVNLPEC